MYLCDMGLARVKAGMATLTRCGADGTPGYISPETAIHRQCGLSSDVWAFGLILIELCTRKRAWGGLVSTVEITSLLLQKVMPDALKDVPSPFHSICQSCLKYDPKERPTMESVARQIRDLTVPFHAN